MIFGRQKRSGHFLPATESKRYGVFCSRKLGALSSFLVRSSSYVVAGPEWQQRCWPVLPVPHLLCRGRGTCSIIKLERLSWLRSCSWTPAEATPPALPEIHQLRMPCKTSLLNSYCGFYFCSRSQIRGLILDPKPIGP